MLEQTRITQASPGLPKTCSKAIRTQRRYLATPSSSCVQAHPISARTLAISREAEFKGSYSSGSTHPLYI